MKKILSILFILSTASTFAQGKYPIKQTLGSDSTLIQPIGALMGRFILHPYADTTSADTEEISHYPHALIVVGNTIYIRDSTATKWIEGAGGSVNGTAITSLPTLGFVPNTNNPVDWINNVFYQSQAPTATLTGGTTLEYQSAATLTYTLNWTAGRQFATDPLASIVVAGVNETFSQPAQSTSVSGSQSVSFPANTTVTYSTVATTTDSKTATASTSFIFQPKRYFGWISDTTGIGTFGFDDSKITALGNEFSTSSAKTWNTGYPPDAQGDFYVYAYYYTAGQLTNLILNGFPSMDAFNVVQRQFTNALGFTGAWIIYWNKNAQTLPSDIIAN